MGVLKIVKFQISNYGSVRVQLGFSLGLGLGLGLEG